MKVEAGSEGASRAASSESVASERQSSTATSESIQSEDVSFFEQLVTRRRKKPRRDVAGQGVSWAITLPLDGSPENEGVKPTLTPITGSPPVIREHAEKLPQLFVSPKPGVAPSPTELGVGNEEPVESHRYRALQGAKEFAPTIETISHGLRTDLPVPPAGDLPADNRMARPELLLLRTNEAPAAGEDPHSEPAVILTLGDEILSSVQHQGAKTEGTPERQFGERLVQYIERVAKQIQIVEPSTAEGKVVRVVIEDSLLPQTEVLVSREGSALAVRFVTRSEDASLLLTSHQRMIQEQLSESLHRSVSIDVSTDQHDGRSRGQRDAYDEMLEEEQ